MLSELEVLQRMMDLHNNTYKYYGSEP